MRKTLAIALLALAGCQSAPKDTCMYTGGPAGLIRVCSDRFICTTATRGGVTVTVCDLPRLLPQQQPEEASR